MSSRDRYDRYSHATTLSLFSGCGGLDLGFQQEGFTSIGAFDVDPVAIEHHKVNLAGPAEVANLAAGQLPGRDWKGRVTVLLAGSPCQGFSTAGKRILSDPRNDLLLVGGKVAAAIRPDVFVAENVTGVASGHHRRYWEALQALLKTSGYRTAVMTCRADTMGVPQIRTRLFLIAWNNLVDPDFTLPLRPGGTLRSALDHLEGASNHSPSPLEPGSRSAVIASHIAQGQKLCNVRRGLRSVHTWQVPEVFGLVTDREREILEALLLLRRRERRRPVGDADPVSARSLSNLIKRPVANDLASLLRKGYVRRVATYFDLTHTFNGKYRRLAWDAPSLTVDTRFGDYRYFLHPDDDRGFTVREVARIQAFPDSYSFFTQDRQAYTMIGNAVPPPMARCIARLVRTRLLAPQGR